MTTRDRIAAVCANYPLPSLFDGLRKVAEGKYRGPCPMHGGDNINGFGVERYQGRWRWRCFTGDCGGGSAIDIVMSREGCTLREALDILDGGSATVEAGCARLPAAAEPAPPSALLVCDRCRHSRIERTGRTYAARGSRPAYETSPEFETFMNATRMGWEVAPDGIGAVCWWCLENGWCGPGHVYWPLAHERERHAAQLAKGPR
jgi:hypothetical protein